MGSVNDQAGVFCDRTNLVEAHCNGHPQSRPVGGPVCTQINAMHLCDSSAGANVSPKNAYYLHPSASQAWTAAVAAASPEHPPQLQTQHYYYPLNELLRQLHFERLQRAAHAHSQS